MKMVRITQKEIAEAGSYGWNLLLRKHGIDPDKPYAHIRAAQGNFDGVEVTQ